MTTNKEGVRECKGKGNLSIFKSFNFPRFHYPPLYIPLVSHFMLHDPKLPPFSPSFTREQNSLVKQHVRSDGLQKPKFLVLQI